MEYWDPVLMLISNKVSRPWKIPSIIMKEKNKDWL